MVSAMMVVTAYGQEYYAEHMREYTNQQVVTGQWTDIELWPEGAPNSNGLDYSKKLPPYIPNQKGSCFDMMPGIKMMVPKQKNDKPMRAVVICPGGGYMSLAIDHEGLLWGQFFTSHNVAVFVLTYRLPHGNHEVPASDVYQTIRIIKQHAKEWNIDPDQIGVMGSSAGGHLASTVATHATDDVRPAFQILFYPVISMDSKYVHGGSRDNLLGEHPSQELIDLYSNEKQVTDKTPRAFIALADDDTTVDPINSALYYTALKQHYVPACLHSFPVGGHGFGMSLSFKSHSNLLSSLSEWLESFEHNRNQVKK